MKYLLIIRRGRGHYFVSDELDVSRDLPADVQKWAEGGVDLEDGDVLFAVPIGHEFVTRFEVSRGLPELKVT